MSYQNKFDQLNKQSSLLAKKMEEIKKKQSSSSEKAPPDSGGEDKKVVLINNDGNFMENFLKMKQEKSDSKGLGRKNSSQDSGPITKKSRYASMFQQMKKNKQSVNPAPEVPVTYATATCFHGDDSSSDEEPTLKNHDSSTRTASASRDIKAAAFINPVAASVSAGCSSIKPMQPLSSSAETKPVTTKERTKPRKNRWGDKVDLSDIAPPGLADVPGVANVPAPVLPQSSASLGLPQNYRPVGLVGVSTLSDAQKKQLQEQKEMQAMYSLIMANRSATQIMAMQQSAAAVNQKPKYEYDSDEEIDDKTGTWEHQKRRLEMEKTQALAEKLTEDAQGKHFIGDFLPPAELDKFMETFKALKEGRTPDYSDYKEFKIQCDNIGFKMLEKMGWSEGEGLGSGGQGRTIPVNQGSKSLDGRGLGVEKTDNLTKDDDDFSAYRKRMMLAYRFRPNPLNNPRRPYY